MKNYIHKAIRTDDFIEIQEFLDFYVDIYSSHVSFANVIKR